jgi:TGF-beta propeptide
MVAAVLATVLQGPASAFAATNPVRLPAGHSTAPVKLPASSGEPASKQPRKLPVGEQPDLRTRFSSTRYNADHSFTTSTSIHPVNYRTAGGWQPIDNTLGSTRQSGYAYQNRANSFQAQFKSQMGDAYLRWVVDGQAVSMSLEGASRAPASTKGSTIRYQGALPHVNATYSVLGDGLEEVLELQDASAQAGFQFLLKTPKVTTARQQPDGSWAFALPGRAPVSFGLKAPYAYDSGTRSVEPGQSHAQMSVQESGDGFQVTLSVDGTWLHDPSRRFPVFLDPTISVQPDTLDATFTADCATCQGFVDPSGRMFIGVSAFPQTYREALQFDLSAIPAGVSVTSASLGVFYDQACIAVPGQFCGGIDHQVDVHRMTAPWSTSSATSAVQFDPTVLSSFLLSASAGQEWMNWDVSSAVSGWVSGAQPNDGLYLMLSSERKGDSGPAPPGNSFQVGQLAPVLTVTYSGDAVSLAQPSTLHANGAELTWSQYTGPSGAPFQQYQVHRSLSPNFTPSAATQLTSIADLSTTTFRDTTAAPGGTFYYAVVANSSKSNEVKVTLPADGQSSVSLQPGPGQDRATFMYLFDRFVNCANYGADQFLAAGADSSGVYRSLLRFDLPQIPSTATNVSAKLNVLHFFENSIDMTFHAYPVTSS